MASNQHSTRRAFLKSIPAAAAIAAVPVAGVANNDTPIMSLFRQWQEAHRLGNDMALPEQETDAWGDRMSEIENEMLSIPSQTMGDVAAKIAAWTSFGDYALSDTSDQRIWDEIKALVGVAA